MLAQRSSTSYTAQKVQQDRMRGAGREAAAPSPDRLLTDRTSYIAYLESQLERVSAACLTVSSFDGRLEEAVSAVRLLEDKTLNLARLISTAQQFAEQQGESVGEVCRRLRAVEARLAELEQPGRAAEWEDKLRAVSARVDSQAAQLEATAEQRLKAAAAELQAGLEEACHGSHLHLERKLGEAAGRLTEVERRVRAVDEYAHQADHGAAVADLAGRLGSVEDSVAHLAKSDCGMKSTLGSLQAAVGQLKTAMVAVELRPLGAAAADSADCLQWLERAREALRREVADIQQQHGQLAAGLHSVAAAAAAAPQSPQKALAAQVLSGLQSSMQQEVGKEVQALQLAGQMLASVASSFASKPSPPAGVPGHQAPHGATEAPAAADASDVPGPAASKAASAAESGASADASSGGWTIAAVPAASADVAAAKPVSQAQVAYPPAPSSQQALSAAADGALAQLQQLAGGEQQLAQASLAAAAAAGGAGGGGGLRSSLGQMQQMLHSVQQMLQQDAPAQQQQPPQQQQQQASEPGYQAAAVRYLSRSSTLQRGGLLTKGGAVQAKQAWVPGGSSTPAGVPAPAPAASRALSYRPTSAGAALCGSGSSAKEALRESVLGHKALAERRKRLQELYAELQQQA